MIPEKLLDEIVEAGDSMLPHKAKEHVRELLTTWLRGGPSTGEPRCAHVLRITADNRWAECFDCTARFLVRGGPSTGAAASDAP
jgi:hypothetical protein